MATTSLGIHYYIKDGHRDTVLSRRKGVIDLCAKEPEFINAIIFESPERPNQFTLQALWRGTRADFDAAQGVKPYRKAYPADVKQQAAQTWLWRVAQQTMGTGQRGGPL